MPNPTFTIELDDEESWNIISALEDANRDMQSDIDHRIKAGSDRETTLKAWIAQNEAIIAKIKAGEEEVRTKLATGTAN